VRSSSQKPDDRQRECPGRLLKLLDRDIPVRPVLSGREQPFGGLRATTDAVYLTEAGTPTVIFGPGSMDQASSVVVQRRHHMI
jgi:hypothetical protein